MVRRGIGIGLVGILAVIVLIGGVTDFRALNRGHLGMVNALDGECYDIGGLSASTINCLITAQGAARRTLLLGPETWVINSNVTVPANIELWVAPGALLTVSTGMTLTINGGLHAPHSQIFSHLGTGRVRFGGAMTRLKAVWWGVVCNDSTDNLLALNAVMTSAFDGQTIDLPYGVCRTSPWDVAAVRGLVFEGAGGSPIGAFAADGTGTTLKAIGSQTHLMRVSNAQYMMFRNITFDGNLQTTLSVVVGDYENGPSSHVTFERSIITRTLPNTGNLLMLGLVGEPSGQQQADYWVFREGVIDQDLTGGGTLADRCVKITGSNVFLNWIEKTRISGCIHGVEMNAGSVSLHKIDFGVATSAHIQINQAAQSFSVTDSYTEVAGPKFLKVIAGTAEINSAPVIYLERNTINVVQSASEWLLTQPLVMVGNTFSSTGFVVNTLGDSRSKYRVTAVGNTFNGDNIGFAGTGLAAVDEFLTQHHSTAGALISQTILRGPVTVGNTLQVDAIALGPVATPVSRLQGVTFADNFGTITSGLCAESPTAHTFSGVAVNIGSFFAGRMDIPVPTGFQVSAKVVGTGSIKFMVCNFSGTNSDPDGAGTSYTAYLILP